MRRLCAALKVSCMGAVASSTSISVTTHAAFASRVTAWASPVAEIATPPTSQAACPGWIANGSHSTKKAGRMSAVASRTPTQRSGSRPSSTSRSATPSALSAGRGVCNRTTPNVPHRTAASLQRASSRCSGDGSGAGMFSGSVMGCRTHRNKKTPAELQQGYGEGFGAQVVPQRGSAAGCRLLRHGGGRRLRGAAGRLLHGGLHAFTTHHLELQLGLGIEPVLQVRAVFAAALAPFLVGQRGDLLVRDRHRAALAGPLHRHRRLAGLAG